MPDVPPICEALREAVEASGLTQEALARGLGEKQQTISRWLRTAEPRLDDLVRIEDALDLPRGYLLRAAGYTGDFRSTRECLEADPTLNPEHRHLLLGTYDAAIALAKQRRGGPKKPGG